MYKDVYRRTSRLHALNELRTATVTRYWLECNLLVEIERLIMPWLICSSQLTNKSVSMTLVFLMFIFVLYLHSEFRKILNKK